MKFLYKKIQQNIDILKWFIKGKPIPVPHIIKQKNIKKYIKSCKVFIETGTYKGEMIEAMKNKFNKIYSIEINNDLYKEAKNKFKNDQSIEIINGDSGILLDKILTKVKEPAVFWLDGHYSGGITSKGVSNTPIHKELDAIHRNLIKNHIVLIDDAHCFTGKDDYPTISEIKEYIKNIEPQSKFIIKDNIIKITNI